MAPLAQASASMLSKRYYYYSSSYDTYYKGRMIGIIVGCVVFVLLLTWYVIYRNKANKRKRLASLGPLPYAPGGVLSPISLPPPLYSGPSEQAPTWNGTQWQGPRGEDGSEGPYWNGLNWCKDSGPVWNGVTWVNAGPVRGVSVPMNENTGRVWNGAEWIGGWPGSVQMQGRQQENMGGNGNIAVGHESGVVDWHKRDLEGGAQAPAPAYMGEENRRDSLRRDGVNADGGLGHVATQSRDFGAPKHDAAATATAAPEVKEEESGFKKFLKMAKGGK